VNQYQAISGASSSIGTQAAAKLLANVLLHSDTGSKYGSKGSCYQ